MNMAMVVTRAGTSLDSSQDSKQAAAGDVLPDGSKVTRGTFVGYVPYSMGHMKFLWGEGALEFMRSGLKDGNFQPESPFEFTSFHAGARICLGKDSTCLQMKMTAELVLRSFHIHLVPGHIVTYRTMFVLSMLHGLQVTDAAMFGITEQSLNHQAHDNLVLNGSIHMHQPKVLMHFGD